MENKILTGKYWKFTLNNWSESEFVKIKNCNYIYICVGKEIGIDKNTPHLQGFVVFERDIRDSSVRGRLGSRTWFEKVHWNKKTGFDDLINYCKKDGNFFENGVCPVLKQGKRNDLSKVIKVIDNEVDKDFIDICKQYPEVCAKNFKFMQFVFDETRNKTVRFLPKDYPVEWIWYYGQSGKGKSHRLFTVHYPERCKIDGRPPFLWKRSGGDFCNRYKGEKSMIMNEFSGGLDFAELCGMADVWPFHVNAKGRDGVSFLVENIYVSSACHPLTYFVEKQGESLSEQFFRRFKVFEVLFDGNFVERTKEMWIKGKKERDRFGVSSFLEEHL